MIPIDGPVRENVGLLGSPCFEIPRAVERDKNFNHVAGRRGPARAAHARRTCHNIVTMVALPAGATGCSPSSSCCSAFMPRCCTIRCTASLALLAFGMLLLAASILVFRVPRAGEPRLQAAASRRSCRSTTRISGSTSGTGSSASSPLHVAVQGHALQERDLAPAGREARPQGVRRRLPAISRRP